MARDIDFSRAIGAHGAVRFAVNMAAAAAGALLLFVAIGWLLYANQTSERDDLIRITLFDAAYFMLLYPLATFGLRAMNPILASVAPLIAFGVAAPMVWGTIDRELIHLAQAFTPWRSANPPDDYVNPLLNPMSMSGVVFWGGMGVLIFSPFLWAFLRVATLGPRLREMSRLIPRTSSFGGLVAEIFGFWPGFRRPLLMRLSSDVLTLCAALFQSAGAALTAITTLVVLATVPMSAYEPWSFLAVPFTFAIAAAISWVPLFAASGLRNAARSLTRQTMDSRLKHDQRSPILFLRSFQDDQVSLPKANILARAFAGELGVRRLDHILVEHFSRYGPVLALGKPGEKSLPFGAARIYAAHEDWQATVHELASKARYIVLIADPTPGVAWEIENVLFGPHREKVLALCAPAHGDLRRVPLLKNWLPDDAGKTAKRKIIAAYFDQDGEPVTLSISGKVSASAYQIPLQAFFRERSSED